MITAALLALLVAYAIAAVVAIKAAAAILSGPYVDF
jgi:hypothetical protein